MSQRRIISYEEQTAYTAWRRLYYWTQRAGSVKAVKRRTHRRERREAAFDIVAQMEEQ